VVECAAKQANGRRQEEDYEDGTISPRNVFTGLEEGSIERKQEEDKEDRGMEMGMNVN